MATKKKEVTVTNVVLDKTDMRVKLKGDDKMFVPQAKTDGAAGLDLVLANDVVLREGEVQKVGTGVHVEIPVGHVGLVFLRSSISDVTMTNGVGVIDSDYRGEIILKLRGVSRYSRYTAGDRVAQLVVMKYLPVNVIVSDKLSSTERGDGGFGSTGA